MNSVGHKVIGIHKEVVSKAGEVVRALEEVEERELERAPTRLPRSRAAALPASPHRAAQLGGAQANAHAETHVQRGARDARVCAAEQ